MVTIANNDLYDIMARGGMERFLDNGKVQFKEPPAMLKLTAHCHLSRFFLYLRGGEQSLGLSRAGINQKHREAMEKLAGVVAGFQQLADKENFRLLVILYPSDLREILQQKLHFKSDSLVRFLHAHDIHYVELLPVFAQRVKLEEAEVRKLFWPIDTHYNAQGYEIFAEGIAAYILDHKLIDEKQP